MGHNIYKVSLVNMDKLKVTDAKLARTAVEAEKQRQRDEKRNGFLNLLSEFTTGSKGPVMVERNLDAYFDWDEVIEMTHILVEKGFVVVCGRGYFCVEVPLEGSREPGVYCGDQESIEKYEKMGFSVHDISPKTKSSE